MSLVPAAADDVLSMESAPFYNIDAFVDLVGNPPRVYALQDTIYTNATDGSLSVLYFRTFPNKPSYGTELTVSEVTVDGQAATVAYEVERTALRVELPIPLQPGASATVHMAYDVTVPVDTVRGYGTFNYQDGIMILANFYPMVAVHEGLGWNLSLAPDYGDPVYAASSFYTVQFTLAPEYTLVTSGMHVDKRQNDDGTVTWTQAGGPMRDFCVVISDRFEFSSVSVGNVRVNSYYLPDHSRGGEEVLAYARDGLRAYQQAFGAYPFAEFDVVEAPIYSGGMEYPALVMMGEQYYQAGGELFEFLAAHEVAHQWWYSVVGNDQVNVPWLDESLTNFSTVYYYEQTYGKARAEMAFEQFVARSYELFRQQGRDLAVHQPVDQFAPHEYGPIVYGKGALFFAEVRELLGDELFLEALRRYYQDRRYMLATPEDLLRVVEDVSGQELDQLYQEWMLNAD
jgi:aminopeptidase N